MILTILLDLLLVGLVVYGARQGFNSGAWYQVKHTGVLIVAVWVPVHFGAPLAHLLEARLNIRYNVLFVGSVTTLWLITEFSLAFAVRLLESAWLRAKGPAQGGPIDHRKRIRHVRPDATTRLDRYSGAAIGGLDMVVMLWLALSLFVLVEQDLGVPVSQSHLFQFVDRRNAITMLFAPQADKLEHALQKAAAKGQRIKDPFAKLRGDPRMKTVLDNAAHKKDVLGSAQGLSAVTDPENEAQLNAAIAEAEQDE